MEGRPLDRAAPALVLALAATACSRPAEAGLGAPVASFDLPPELEEVSGLVAVAPGRVACVEDERGLVYTVDLGTGAVVERRRFGPDGDYEGLARVGDTLWVLRSDGVLLRLRDERGGLSVAEEVELDVGHDELEGLAWDPVDDVLLVAAKGAPAGNGSGPGVRRVFAVDPGGGAASARVALSVDVERILADASAGTAWSRARHEAEDGRGDDLRLRFSGLAVHPSDGTYWLLSAADDALLVLDRRTRLLDVLPLDAEQLPQAEGIAFLASGDLVVASEADGGTARVQVFAAPRCAERR